MGDYTYLLKKIRKYSAYGDKLSLADDEEEMTYFRLNIELNKRIKFINSNTQEREAVINCGSNSVEFILNHLAIISSNRVSVPLDKDTPREIYKHIIEEVKPTLIITEENKNIEKLIKFDKETKISELSKALRLSCTNTKKYPKSINVIMYTTGTSGTPKGVMLSLSNIKHTAYNVIKFCKYDTKSFQLITLPLSHSFGMGQLYSMILCGGAAYLEKGMARGKKIKYALEKYEINGFPTTPSGVELIISLYRKLFTMGKLNIKDIVVNSAPLSSGKAIEIMNLMPNTKIYTYYGMTEASRSTMICLNDVESDYYEHVGLPMNGNIVKIDNENSEILLAGKNIMIGYICDYNKNKKNYRAKEIRSGDIGTIDGKSYLKITGRIKDQINVGGYKISPLEVEKIINNLAYIRCSAVIGIEDENRQEKIVSFIETYDKNITDINVYKDINSKLEYYKIPKEIIIIDEIPKITNGKIDRLTLKKIYKRGLK
jgi:long-chain acyl-CoA synthetase